MSDKPFYFVRHGQSEANAAGVPAGIVDSPLTVQGRTEAESLRPFVTRLIPAPQRIVTSRLSRAAETAAILNRNLDLPTTVEPELGEQNYGDFVHDLVVDVKAKHGDKWYLDPPNGEKFSDFQQRILRGLRRALDADDGLPVIVAHGGMIIALREYFSFELRGVHNCAIYLFDRGKVEGVACPWNIHTYDFTNDDVKRTSIFDRKAS